MSPEGRAPLYRKGVVQEGTWEIPKIKFTNSIIFPRICPVHRKDEETLFIVPLLHGT